MNHSYDQGFDESDHHSLVSKQESTAYEYHSIPTTNNAAAAGDTFGVAELTPENAREYHHFPGDASTEPIQHKAIPRASQGAHVDSSCENTDFKGKFVNVTDDQTFRDKKRKNDQPCRTQYTKKRRKMEEELKDLRKQNATLQKELHKIELKPNSERRQNESEFYCKMEFRLDCHDKKSRAHAMKIVGGVTGMKRVCMDIEENKLTLHGKDIDTLLLQGKLKKICNARLLSLSIEAKLDHEKNEEKIMVKRDSMIVARNLPLVLKILYQCLARRHIRILSLVLHLRILTVNHRRNVSNSLKKSSSS